MQEALAVHEGIQCDGCNQNPLKGVRYKCGTCESYDLCSSCESNTTHDPAHVFIQIKPPAGDGEAVPVTNVTVKFHKSVNETTTFTVIKLNSTHTVGALIDAIADLSPYIPHADLPTLTRSVTRGIFKPTSVDDHLNRSIVSYSVEFTLSHNSRPPPSGGGRLACRKCF